MQGDDLSTNNGHLSWKDWLNAFDWDEAREEVDRESRGRVVITGLIGAGKSTLLNRLFGWAVSDDIPEPVHNGENSEWTEDYGLFCLVDLPYKESQLASESPDLNRNAIPLELAENADLIIFILDGATDVRPVDFRWIGRLRRLARPLLIVLNKADLLGGDLVSAQERIQNRLAASVLPVSALTGKNVLDRLVPKMVDLCPRLAVPLGRELRSFRRQMAARITRQTTFFNGAIALEPMPFFDLPFQMLALVRMVSRIAAVYDRPPTDAHRKEVVAAMAGGLAGRYLTQQAVKFIPVAGWVVSGFIAATTTWLMGRGAVAYFEANGDEFILDKVNQTQTQLNEGWQLFTEHASEAGVILEEKLCDLPNSLKWLKTFLSRKDVS